MSTPSTKKQLLEELGAAGRSSSRLSIMFREAVAGCMGIGATDMECLDFLLEQGTATAGDLAKAIGLTSGAMTAALDRLEHAHYVKRQSDPRDRRKVVVVPILKHIRPASAIYESFAAEAMARLGKLPKSELVVIIQHHRMMSELYRQQIDYLVKSKLPKN